MASGNDSKAQQFNGGLPEKEGFKIGLGFTKTNELFVGRMAMLGIASSIIGGKSRLQYDMPVVEKILVGLSQGSKPKFSCFIRRIIDWQGRIITARMRNWASHFRIGLGYPCGSSLQSYCRANPY